MKLPLLLLWLLGDAKEQDELPKQHHVRRVQGVSVPANAPLTAFFGFEPFGEATEEPAPLFQPQPANADPSPVVSGLFEPPEGVTAFAPFVGGVATLVQPPIPVGGGPATALVGGGAAAVVPIGRTVTTNTGCNGSSFLNAGSGVGTSTGTITGGSTSTVPISNGVGFGGSSATTSNLGSPIINCILPANVVVTVPAAIILPPPPAPPPTRL